MKEPDGFLERDRDRKLFGLDHEEPRRGNPNESAMMSLFGTPEAPEAKNLQ